MLATLLRRRLRAFPWLVVSLLVACAVGLRAQPIVVTPSSSPNWTVGAVYPATPFSASPSATYAWSGTGLPPGLSIDPNSGILSGTPTASNVFSVTITATNNSIPASGSVPYSLTINPAPAITDPTPLPKGNLANAYGYSFGTSSPVSGGTPPFTWSNPGGGIPQGLGLSSTGVLSGTPTKTGLFGFTIAVTDASGVTGSKSFGMVVGTLPLVVSGPASLPTSSLTVAYPPPGAPAQPYFSAANGSGTYSWSASGLPAGIGIGSPNTPVLSGTPTQSGTFSVTVTATDTLGGSDSKTVALVINPAPSISTTSLADCTAGTFCSRTLSVTGGTLPLGWQVTSGAVPPVMNLSSGGVLSGTPSSVSSPTTSSFTVSATDAAGASGSQPLSIRVNPAVAITTSSPLPPTTSGQTYTQTIAATGGTGTLTWSGSGLPGWLSISSGGVLSGTAPAVASSTTSPPFSLQAADVNGSSSSKSFSVTVNPVPTISPSTLSPWTAGQPYTATFTPVGGTPPFTLTDAVVPPSLPAWLTLNGSTLSGTPPVPGGVTYPFSIKVADSTGANSTQAYSLLINPPPTVITGSLPATTSGAFYTQALTASDGTSPLKWSGSGLPSWLTVLGGSVTGTAPSVTTSTNYPFSVTVTDAAGATNTRALSVTVNPIPVILTVTPSAGQQGQTLASVAVVGQGTNFVNGTTVANFGAGIAVNSTTVTDATHATVSITIAVGIANGGRTVAMTTGSEVASLANGFTVVAPGTPLIQSVTPNAGQQGQTLASVAVAAQSTNFVNGTTVANFGAGVAVNSTTVTDATHATVSITIAAGAATGARTVTMTTGSEVASLAGGFTVTAPGTPLIQSVTPNTGQQGQTLASVAVVGQSTNFVNGTTVANFGAGVAVNSTTVTDATHATVSITIAAGAATGARAVTLTTINEVASLASGFTVTATATPVIQSVTPNTGQQGQTLASVSVVGQSTNFVNGTTLANFGAGIAVNSTNVTDATHATVSITIAAGAGTGGRTVTMTTGSEVAALANGFTVTAAATPVIQSVTPNTGQQGQTLASVAVVGQSTNFLNGTTVANFGAGIAVNSTTVTDATHATVSITIAAGAGTGGRTVTLTTGGEVASLANGFTVTAAATPAIQAVTPNTGQQGQTLTNLVVVGQSTNFVNGTSIANFGAGIAVNSTTVTDATHATVSITIAAGAATGARTVTMTTVNEVASLANGFTVVAPGTPLLQSVTPNTGQQGQTLANVAVVGQSTNFVNGTSIANFGAGIAVNSTTVTDATHATVSITIAAGAGAGLRTVSITTSSEVASLAGGFTVVAAGTPLILTVTPGAGQPSQSIASVSVVGLSTNFLNGTTVANFGTGIAVNSTTVTDATHATVSITIAAGAATGARAVTLTTVNEVATLANGFTVVTAGTPLLQSVTPNSGQQGQTLANVAVVGQSTNFVNGSTVANFGAGIVVNATTVSDASHATVSITIAANTAPGARTVTMITGSEIATLANGFTVASATPVIQSVTPNIGQQGQSLASVAIVGQSTNFVNGTTTASFGSGITVNATTVTDATHATVNITIAANATPGPRTVTMTTGAEVAGMVAGFTVTATAGPNTPVLLSITPNTGQPGQTLANVAVAGQFTNFINGTTTASFGAGITVNSTTVTDATHATVSLTIAANASAGPRTVTLATGSEAASLGSGFAVTVIGVTPVIQTVSPNTGQPGQTLASVAVVGQGTNFVAGTTAADFGAGITVNATTVIDATHAAVSLTIAANAVQGPRTVTMTTGSEVAALANGFSIIVNTGAPTILTVTPSFGLQEETITNVQVLGQFTNFVDGTTTADFGPGIAVNSIIVADATHATVSVTIAAKATPGGRAVTLTTGLEVAATPSGFVVDPAVTITTPSALQPWTEGRPYSVQLAATGGTSPITFSDPSASLPAWLILNGSTLSGTPPSPGGTTYSFNLQATDELGANTTKAFTVLINKPPAVSPTTLPDTTSGVSYNASLTAVGGTAPFTWSASGAPQWLTVSGASLAGTAPAVTTVTAFGFDATVTDLAGATARATVQGNINPPVSLVPSLLPQATSGNNYSAALMATGGTAPVMFSIVGSGLPSGILLGADGLLSGMAPFVSQPTNFQFQVIVTDKWNSSDSKQFVLTVIPQPFTISTTTLTSGTAGVPYNMSLAAAGGVPPYTWTFGSAVLPTGLQLNSTTGVLSGTPTEGGSFVLAASVSDKQGNQASKGFTLLINSNLKISSPPQLMHGSAGAAYSLGLQTTGAAGGVSWSTTQGALPNGLALNAGSGTISGIPSLVGTFNARVRAQDATGVAASQVVTIVIDPASLPAVNITGLGATLQPAQQVPIALNLSTAFPLDITGQLTLTFTPNPSVGVVDPTILFGGGGASITFRIPVNTTQAIFDQLSTLQTGSLAGTISLDAVFQTAGAPASPASPADASSTTPPLPPLIVGTPTATRAPNSVQISLTALATSRQVTSATYHFVFTAASQQAPIDVNVGLGELVSPWYATPDSLQFGSLFGYTQAFNVNGDVNQLSGVTITITNNQGTSQAANVSF